MYQRGKKLLSMLLVLCMVVSLVPVTAQAAILEGEDYITQQLYLGEDIVLHLRGDIPEAYRNATAVITFCGESKSCAISDLTQDENGLYDMAVEVDVAEMTENISLKATYLGLTAIEENYSVAGYLKTLISGNYTQQTKFLALELLNFGAAAQNYFDYNTGNLANAGGYEYAPANAVPSDVPTVDQSGRVDGVKFYGASVRFLSKTAVRFYFEADSVDGLTFTVDGNEYAPSSNDSGYYIEVGGINPQDMDNEMTVEVTDGTDTLSVKYAPIYYFIRTYHNSENEEMKTLAAAAYSYFVAANNFVGVEPTGDFMEGVYFDDPGNVELFSGVGGDNAWRDALLEIVSVEGNNVLKLTCAESQWPVFRINFGTTFKAGTTIDFRAYTTDISNADKSGSKSLFEGMPGESYLVYSQGSDATDEYPYNTWTDLTIVLAEDREYVDLVCNMDRTNDSITCTNIEVYMDNFKASEPVEISGDILEGLDFEDAGNALWFTGTGAAQDAKIRNVSYTDANVTAPENGGSNVLKLSHSSHYYHTFQMNFGQTLKAGTTITFQVYGAFDGWKSGNDMNIEFTGDSGSGQVVYMVPEAWSTATITLTEDRDHLQFFWNIERGNGISGNVASYLLIDNVKATLPPVEPTGNAVEGYDFEIEGHAERFTGIGYSQDATVERVTYSDAGVAAPENGGSYAVKLSHSSHYYPTFQMNFGKTLKAGTTITFNVWGTFDGWKSGNDMNIEFTGDSGSGQVVYMVPEAWFTAEITLSEACDHLQFFWNIERGNGISGDVASYILIDNVKAVEPPAEPTGDILEGIGFETEGNELRFTGIGASQDATVERVTYSNAGVAAPENGGSNVLKLSHNSHYYPTFQLNFGKTLEAGTTITFNVYGAFDGWQSGNDMNIEFTGDSGSGQVVYMVPEAWFTATITLTEDRDHLQFFWNIERGNGISGDVASYILIDNVKAVEPPAEPTGDILEGIGFETEGNELRFTGIGASQDATIERVTYTDAGITAPENGSEYVLKMSHASHYYPTFQLNFGKTLEAGTTITFQVYGTFDGWVSGNDMNIELTGDSKNVHSGSNGDNQVAYMVPGAWFTGTVTLSADCDHLQFFWNIERGNGISGDVASYILIDNVKAVEPDNTFYNGLTFDNSTDVNYFGTVSGQEWRSPALEIVSFDGDNALKVTCGSSQWPALRINFGRTLPTGTQIAFQAYTNDTTGIRNTVSIFEAMANCTETAQYYHGSWANLVTTLTADCSYIDLCVNFDRWNEITPSNIEVYIDNVIVQQGFTAGADFEMPYDARFFTGAANGNEWRDATAQIVEKDGSNVLMMTGANSLWPTFKIDFGETLKAGTTITFDVLGVIDYEQEGMSMTFNPIDSNVVTDEYGQAVWMLCDEWTNKTITLSADCSSISFYWDAGRNGLSDGIVSYVYIDNVVVNAA